jgi:hypothetical protein
MRARGRIFRIVRSIQARAFSEFSEAAMRDGSNLRSLRSIPMRAGLLPLVEGYEDSRYH